MRKWVAIFCFGLFVGVLPTANVHAQEKASEFIDLQITSAFSPDELHTLIQKLGKRGILLRFEETGYCNGELRILKGEIINSDGSRFGFETKALRSLNIRLVAQTKALGVQAIRIKNRWRKCKEADTEPVSDEDEGEYSQPVQQI
ncbi:MAG: hypothetical protein C0424_06530 [Sphingobacteriaceae bacterium]|nr:hypothetical protein [Sphingobacteriaceae bacterium]